MGIKGKVYGGLGVWGGEASQSTVSGGSDRVRSGLNFFVQGEKKRNSVSLNLSKEKKNRFDRVFIYINSKSVVVECSSIVKNKSQNKSLISTDRSN